VNETIPSLFGHPADPWQCEVFDYCPPNQAKSCLICAPTSAGKTFLAREIMRRFVHEKRDGLVVYLCPTKALAAMVFRDLAENLHQVDENGAKCPVVGLFTKDFRVREAEKSTKILVIIPELLELLVLGPFGDRVRGRITCLIIDEAHYLGVADRGPVLERFFSMISAPFYAFSATLEAASLFLDWIRPVKPDARLIPDLARGGEKITRSTDLAYYVYDCTATISKKKKQNKKVFMEDENETMNRSNRFIPLNPFSLLENESDVLSKLRLFPDLLPHQLIRSINLLGEEGRKRIKRVLLEKRCEIRKERIELVGVGDDSDSENVSAYALFCLLCEANEIVSFPFLRKHVSIIDHTLRESILELTKNEASLFDQQLPHSHQTQLNQRNRFVDIFLASMRNENRNKFEQIQAVISRKGMKSMNTEAPFFAAHVMRVIENLEMKKMLPAMCFFFRVNDLDKIVMTLLDLMPLKLHSHPELTRRLQDLNQFEMRGTILNESTPEVYAKVMECLKRGWGIHHAGLPLSIRNIMEELFACGALNVIFCTTTLATGVHTPCKSVILFRDHADHLNAVEFHQMIGRAGRRNNDSVGNVILMFLSAKRTREMICTRFTEIYGELGLSFSFLLRCIAAIKGSMNEKYVDELESWKAYELMLSRPFYLHAIGVESDNESGAESHVIARRAASERGFQHYLNLIHLSLISLQNLCLLDAEFNPIDLYMIVSRIAYIEPFNIALVSSIISQSVPIGFAQYGNFRLDEGYAYQKRRKKASLTNSKPTSNQAPKKTPISYSHPTNYNLSNSGGKTDNANESKNNCNTTNTFGLLSFTDGDKKNAKSTGSKNSKSKKASQRTGTTQSIAYNNFGAISPERMTNSNGADDEMVQSDFLTVSTILRMLVDYDGSKVYSRNFPVSERCCFSEALRLLEEKRYRELQSLLADVPVGFLLPVPPMMMDNLTKYNHFIRSVAQDFTMSSAEPIVRGDDKLLRQMLVLSHSRFSHNSQTKTVRFDNGRTMNLKKPKNKRIARIENEKLSNANLSQSEDSRNEVGDSRTEEMSLEMTNPSNYFVRSPSDAPESMIFSFPAAFGPCHAINLPSASILSLENLDLFFAALNQHHMMKNLPLVKLNEMKNKVFCSILSDLVHHPSLVPEDASRLFGHSVEYHKRQLEASWDLLKKVLFAMKALLVKVKEIARDQKNGIGLETAKQTSVKTNTNANAKTNTNANAKTNTNANAKTTTANAHISQLDSNAVDNRIVMTEYLEMLFESMNKLSEAVRRNNIYRSLPLLELQKRSVFIVDKNDKRYDGGVNATTTADMRAEVEADGSDEEEENDSCGMNYHSLEKEARSPSTNPQKFFAKLSFKEKQRGAKDSRMLFIILYVSARMFFLFRHDFRLLKFL
jgi:hypothetical protein